MSARSIDGMVRDVDIYSSGQGNLGRLVCTQSRSGRVGLWVLQQN